MQKYRIKSLYDNNFVRAMEGSTNFTKIMIWMLTCVSILKYAENVKACFSAKSISLKEVLSAHLGDKYADYIMAYYKMKQAYFMRPDGSYKEYKNIEKKWFLEDAEFTFSHNNMEIK